MDELQLITNFRAKVPPASDQTKRRARERLAVRFEARASFGLPRRRVLVWVAAALLAGLLAGSAFAFGDRVIDFIRGEPAPKPVQRDFQRSFGPVRSVVPFFDFPTVIKSRIHGVLAFRTRQGPVALWAGPSRDGGVCFIIKRLRPKTLLDQIWTGVSTCVPKGVPGGRPLVAQVKSIEPTSNGGPAKDPTYAYGIVGKNIVRVEVRLSDGSVHRANVHEHFFGVGVPPKYPCTTRSCAYDAARVLAVGFDASGRKVGTYRQGAPPKPVPPPPPPARTGPFRTVFNAEKAGHRVVFGVAPAAGGGLCTQQSWSGQRGFRSPCRSRSHKTVELLGAGGGGPPDWGFLIGRAQNGVASVDLRFEDGTSTALKLTPGRFFLVFLGGRRTVPGHRALAFVARDRAGRVVARERLGHPLGG